jgi:hypothetical protein
MAKYFMPDRGGGYSNLLIDSINSGMLHPELTYSKYPIMSLDERLIRF